MERLNCSADRLHRRGRACILFASPAVNGSLPPPAFVRKSLVHQWMTVGIAAAALIFAAPRPSAASNSPHAPAEAVSHIVEAAQAPVAEPAGSRIIWIIASWVLISGLGFSWACATEFLIPRPFNGPKGRIKLVDTEAAVRNGSAVPEIQGAGVHTLAPPDKPDGHPALVHLTFDGDWVLDVGPNMYKLVPRGFRWTSFKVIRGDVICTTLETGVGNFEMHKCPGDLNALTLHVAKEDGTTIDARLKPTY